MKRAFSNTVVHSSLEDQNNSSEEEESPTILYGNNLKNCLTDIPSFSGDTSKLTSLTDRNGNN